MLRSSSFSPSLARSPAPGPGDAPQAPCRVRHVIEHLLVVLLSAWSSGISRCPRAPQSCSSFGFFQINFSFAPHMSISCAALTIRCNSAEHQQVRVLPLLHTV